MDDLMVLTNDPGQHPFLKLDIPADLYSKVASLVSWYEQFKRVAVSYSGGVDSALVAYTARVLLGEEGMIAVVADSPSLPRRELDEALAFAHRHDIPVRTIQTSEGDDPGYTANAGDRCYFCKLELFTVLHGVYDSDGCDAILSGTNLDDTGDYRPGLQAAREQQVRSPLLENGFTKEDIRELSRVLGLETWDKPALACLASRIPHGEQVTSGKLAMIEAAEEVLWQERFMVFRVRHHGDLGRIEIGVDEVHRFEDAALRERIFEGVLSAGFSRVELDPEPYRTGRLNEDLPSRDRRQPNE
ncbi:ATP-dependent sacrificial sulfur transferase LarE [Gemmatimonadota bacterium]